MTRQKYYQRGSRKTTLSKGVGSNGFGTTLYPASPHGTTKLSKYYMRMDLKPPEPSPTTMTLSKHRGWVHTNGFGTTWTQPGTTTLFGSTNEFGTTWTRPLQDNDMIKTLSKGNNDTVHTDLEPGLGLRKQIWNQPHKTMTLSKHWGLVHANGFGTTWTQPHDNNTVKTLGWVNPGLGHNHLDQPTR
jgi:hypothetical protein